MTIHEALTAAVSELQDHADDLGHGPENAEAVANLREAAEVLINYGDEIQEAVRIIEGFSLGNDFHGWHEAYYPAIVKAREFLKKHSR